MARYLLECLGSLKVQNSQFSGKKPLLLLAYLVLEASEKKPDKLSRLFFHNVGNPKGSLSDAKWKLNHHIDGANTQFELVTKEYKPREVVTDIQLLVEACDKGVSELEAIKALFYKGKCFEDFEVEQNEDDSNEDKLSEEIREWILVWREKVNVLVWDVVLEAAASSNEGYLLIEDVYEKTKTLPEHDIDYCYALLKVGGGYLTEIIEDRLDMESLMSEGEAQVLLEERRGERGDEARVVLNSSEVISSEVTSSVSPNMFTTENAEVEKDMGESEENINSEENTERERSSIPPNLVDLNALLELVKSKLGNFQLPGATKRQVISMPLSVIVPLLLLAFAVMTISVVTVYQYRDMRQISSVSADNSNVNQISQSGENNTITITQGSTPTLASALLPEQRTLQISNFVTSDICVIGSETIGLEASGSVSVGEWLGFVTPEGRNQGLLGVSLASYNIIPHYSHGALLCKLTTESTWRECGAQETLVASEAGCLEFDINDLEKQNNSGAFSVTVTTQKH